MYPELKNHRTSRDHQVQPPCSRQGQVEQIAQGCIHIPALCDSQRSSELWAGCCAVWQQKSLPKAGPCMLDDILVWIPAECRRRVNSFMNPWILHSTCGVGLDLGVPLCIRTETLQAQSLVAQSHSDLPVLGLLLT